MVLLSVLCSFLVALVCILVYHFLLKRNIKESSAAEESRVDCIVDSMPALYYLEEMIMDNGGNMVDLKIHKMNKRCFDYYKSDVDPIGKYSSEVFPGGQVTFLSAANSARQLGGSVNFQYYDTEAHVYYDGVAKMRPNTNLIDFFLIDSTDLHRTQEAVGSLRRQMEVSLTVSHITPVTMYVDTELVTCVLLDDDNTDIHKTKSITLTGDEMFEKFSPESRNELKRLLDDLRDGRIKRVKYDMECEEDRGEGMMKDWYEIRMVVGERHHDGSVKTLVGSMQLVTTRKNMERMLVEAKNKADELNNLKSAFLANMSHEIRTPLNAIVGFSQLLIGADSPEEQQEYSHIIQSNSNQLLQLVDDILDLSKIEAGTIEFNDKDFDLNTVMRETGESLRLRLDPAKPVTMRCELGLPSCTLHLDPNRLVQVLTNLVTNAIKYTESGSITMGYAQKGKQLDFYVKDTGVGIDPQHINDIFDRFVKLNAFVKGNGLGLSICKSIVSRFGGKIWAESEPGKGSTFHFTIPYDADASGKSVDKPKDVQPTHAMPSLAARNTPEADKPTILVAEDNESNYKLVRAILTREYKLVHAWNGKEAVDVFDTCKPDIVIMDINMPVMNGYEAATLIKKKSPATPILALTAYATSADEEKILASGMDAYMSKPVCMPQLRMRLKDLLNK